MQFVHTYDTNNIITMLQLSLQQIYTHYVIIQLIYSNILYNSEYFHWHISLDLSVDFNTTRYACKVVKGNCVTIKTTFEYIDDCFSDKLQGRKPTFSPGGPG